MLLSLNKEKYTVKLVSFERGMGVPILSGAYEGQYDWLTHTFRYGGADLMMREIQECFRIKIDRYIRVNMKTFIDHLVEKNYQNRLVAFMENGSWAPVANKVMKQMFEKSKNITFAQNSVSIKSAINEANVKEIENLAHELMQ